MLDTKEEIEEFFAHAGVKGMKWGSRKAKNEAIKGARTRIGVKEEAYRQLAVNRQLATSVKGKTLIDSQMNKLEKQLFDSKDAEVASMLTTGEKWMAAGTLTFMAAGAGALLYGSVS